MIFCRMCHCDDTPLAVVRPSLTCYPLESNGKDRLSERAGGTPMGMFEGKKGLILGVANDRSIAWAIAQVIMNEGGICGFNHLPDKPDDERQRNRRRVTNLTDPMKDKAKFVLPLDVQKDDDIASFMGKAKEEFGQI